MNLIPPTPPLDANKELDALIATLNQTEQRIEQLTAGEVDAVADSHGRTFLLRRAQEQLRQREASRQTAILNALPAHIALLDAQGFIILANEAWRRFASENAFHGPNCGVGANYLEICEHTVGNETSEALRAADGIRSVLNDGIKSFSMEYSCNSLQEERWFLMTVTPLDNDRHLGVVIMHMNITERKCAEIAYEKLSLQTRQRERILNTALASMIDFAQIYDRAGRLVFVNQPLLNLWGLTLEGVVGKNFIELGYPEELAGKLQRQVQEVFDTRQSITDETPYISPSGLKGFYEYIFSPVFASDGTVDMVVGSTRDYTERKRIDEALRKSEIQLRQSQKMDAIGQLAGGVAHDFNNLLTVILGRAELLKQRTDLVEPVRRSINLIHQTGLRAAVLTRQLLQFSRQQVLQPQVLNLNVLIPNMQEMLRRLISEDIDLVLKLSSKIGKIKADPGQIEQIIMNLVINARDAMPGGGTIMIETITVNLNADYFQEQGATVAGPHVMLAVSDTGVGMDERVRARIFEPFFTTKEQGKGTGLGLSTVYGIVKQAMGNIEVLSELNQGTVFKVYFPEVWEKASTIASNATLLPVKGGGETILLVEDEAGIRDLLNEILAEKGYNVILAHDGEHAVGCGDSYNGEIHLLLTDVVLPKMNGKEAALRLLQSRSGMKVIFMSGYTNDAIVSRGVLDDGIDFLEKPFTPDSVAKRVRLVLDGQKS